MAPRKYVKRCVRATYILNYIKGLTSLGSLTLLLCYQLLHKGMSVNTGTFQFPVTEINLRVKCVL